jgi:predicted transcriptional regulator
MKSISLKLQDQIFAETEHLLESLNTSRNSYINEAVAHYNSYKKRELLELQLKEESALVSQDSLEVLHEFESLEDEG